MRLFHSSQTSNVVGLGEIRRPESVWAYGACNRHNAY